MFVQTASPYAISDFVSHATGARVLIGGAAFALALAGAPALALEREQAIENCRETVGKPIVQACVRSMMRGSGGYPFQYVDGCRQHATSAVRACVLLALQTANRRLNVPLALHPKNVPPSEKAMPGEALQAGFVAPPRTITDITAILDSEKPDPAKIEKLREDADQQPTKNLSGIGLAEFYYGRANARSSLGRNQDAFDDAEKGLTIARSVTENRLANRLRQFMGWEKQAVGDNKAALQIFRDLLRDGNAPGSKGFMFNTMMQLIALLTQNGDIEQAEGYLRRNIALIEEARTSGLPGWRQYYPKLGRSWEGDVELSRGLVSEARGQYREAELAYKRSEEWLRAAVGDRDAMAFAPPISRMVYGADIRLLGVARMKARQGRLAEAEADARRALLAQLQNYGKYNSKTTTFVRGLASVLVDQGRYSDAEQLVRSALNIQHTLGIDDSNQTNALILLQLGGVLTVEHKQKEAAEVYATLDRATATWEPQRRERMAINSGRIYAFYAAGDFKAGIEAARALVKRESGRVGEKHPDTAIARGALAVGLMRAGRGNEAISEFRTAIPLLIGAARENNDDDDTTVAARSEGLRNIVEAYIWLLAKTLPGTSAAVAVETFALADSIRGQSVQKALYASSARGAGSAPMLAELVRKEQDFSKQVNAQIGALNNALSSNSHDEKVIKATNVAIDRLRVARDKARAEINRSFPSYADLIDPKPPSVDEIRATLAADEALLSFYFGRQASFVWAVPKQGDVVFASIAVTRGEIEAKVRKLREALEPNATTISEIPPFDLKVSYDLYEKLLRPVEKGWKQAKSIIVVTNGALGLLPLSLLPTAPADIGDEANPPFSNYRKVPWLARTHGVTMLPSASALRTLRRLPSGRPGRSELVGFGDPYFSKEQEAEATAGVSPLADLNAGSTRGAPLKLRNSAQLESVDSAELGRLPRLPDTAQELRSIAVALEVDPLKVLHLGADANEKTVKTMDLSRVKILAFATHGLVPHQLNGLTQPALALSAPDVAGIEGDGLLTMDEILNLKLDADWVVLSACNTGLGAGAGAEAASGLGRAFFYAGTRALLVTNWAVDSNSARVLVTDLFKRQAADPNATRGEALRQAMLAMIDGGGFTDDNGKTAFSYAHPLFWAPYSIIGDGRSRE